MASPHVPERGRPGSTRRDDPPEARGLAYTAFGSYDTVAGKWHDGAA
jgi:hypothetical protein